LQVVPKAIYLLNFYSGSSMCPATVWIISRLRSRCQNDTAPAPELFFSWTWLRLQLLVFMSVALTLEFSFFIAPDPAPASVRFHTSTLWEPAYDIFILRFQPKTSSFRLPYQCPSSSADCARELFKSSNGLASLLVCTRKKILVEGADFFCATS